MAGFSLGVGVNSSFQVARKRFEDGVKQVERRQWIAVRRAALLAERALKKGIRSGSPGGRSFKALSDITKLTRRGTKPLIDSASLLGSIKTTFDKRAKAAFVGVHRNTRSADGQSMVNIALIHEKGTKPFVIPVTDGVRRFFWFLHLKSRGRISPIGPTTTEILHPGVPERPFVEPTFIAIAPEVEKLIRVAFIENGGPI